MLPRVRVMGAYMLVDHLRRLESEGLAPETVAFPDLERYMAAVGAGKPWREGKRPYGQSALSTAAACQSLPLRRLQRHRLV